ncbi:MAG: D-alanyl-D-alanine carboxypeptidase/D-alanyl-D-alanine-endopeptidase [Streptosporangiales bacterium]|nr:D-alanyl-D-alanine carboxypeptidase/D-alanyl-D-alanine-endopeptidase [Streptosporangiales bacterium]
MAGNSVNAAARPVGSCLVRRSVIGGFVALALGGVLGTATNASAAVSPLAPVPASGGALGRDIDAILDDPRLEGAEVGVVVRGAKSGKRLYARNAGQQLLPASNQKLQTAAAAFGLLGTDYTFRTSVLSAGVRRGSTLRGDLSLKGTGDPTLQAADYGELAAQVAAAGIKKVEGDLVADDTWFDDQRVPSDWDPADLPYSYAAEVSALTVSPNSDFDAGSIDVDVTPGKAGKSVDVATTPDTDYVRVVNNATTGSPGSESTLSVTRESGTNTIKVTGSYPADGEEYEQLVSVENPTLYAANVFRSALKAHGVRVEGVIERGATPRDADRVATRTSMQLSRLAVPFLKLSNNNIAEILVKAIGRKTAGEGSWDAGLAAVSEYVRSLGVDASRLRLTDGSGLSRTNRATPLQVSNLLRAVQTKTWFPAFYNALPIAGQSEPWVGGTLASRMTDTPAAGNVHGKTGTLTGVTALSGYVTDPTGRRLIFSVILNGYEGDAPKDIEDEIAIRLAAGETVEQAAVQRTAGGSARPGAELECSWLNTC